mmetsp:Transcript_9021/g.25883  ORF Transcript_9021/g.25883 Transcript_9021/m.25883 type:complete len:249 (+) Transcript_9021:138-884(+)
MCSIPSMSMRNRNAASPAGSSHRSARCSILVPSSAKTNAVRAWPTSARRHCSAVMCSRTRGAMTSEMPPRRKRCRSNARRWSSINLRGAGTYNKSSAAPSNSAIPSVQQSVLIRSRSVDIPANAAAENVTGTTIARRNATECSFVVTCAGGHAMATSPASLASGRANVDAIILPVPRNAASLARHVWNHAIGNVNIKVVVSLFAVRRARVFPATSDATSYCRAAIGVPQFVGSHAHWKFTAKSVAATK